MFLLVSGRHVSAYPNGHQHGISIQISIDPFNKSNIHSFPLLTTYSAFEILLKTFSFNYANSGKLYILDLLKGSINAGKKFLCISCTRKIAVTQILVRVCIKLFTFFLFSDSGLNLLNSFDLF